MPLIDASRQQGIALEVGALTVIGGRNSYLANEHVTKNL